MAQVTFAAWNTKLAPPSCALPVVEEHMNLVKGVVSSLLDQGCGLLALTEVRRLDVVEWLPASMRPHWECIRDTSGDRHDFDLALLYDTRHATEVQREFVTSSYASSRVRCGLLTILQLVDGAKLMVIVAHWRSDMGGHDEGSARRSAAANALRDAIGKNLRDFGERTHVLVLGDFNAEPFDDAFNALPCARYREVVRKHVPDAWNDVLLYNTSWRWLGESHPWTGKKQHSIAGTYHSGKSSQFAWRTVDQILVSASLLGNTGWTLVEPDTRVWFDEKLYDFETERPKHPIDHLPIVGKLSLL